MIGHVLRWTRRASGKDPVLGSNPLDELFWIFTLDAT